MKAVRIKDATSEQVAVCTCDVCGKPIQQRGWINPNRAQAVRNLSGSYVHGRCM